MATYKEIKGVTVQALDADPVEFVGSWAAGGNLNTARSENTGVGILTAALSIGGNTSPGATAVVEQYNGTAWTETGDLNTARRNTGSGGTYTSSIVAGGDTPGANEVNNVETWDGSSWTETTDLNTARKGLRGAGASSTATVVFGGQIPPNSPTSATSTAITELWNGSSWTEVNNLNTARYASASFGISTAAIMAGGQHNPPPSQAEEVEQWDGSSWTEVADISVRTYLSGGGTTTSGIVFGGQAPPGSGQTQTESWDGTSWTAVNSLATAIQKGAGCGAGNTSALQFGGRDAPDSNYIATTQEWTTTPSALFQKTVDGQLFFNSTTNAFKITEFDIPATSWSSGGNLNTTRWAMGSAARGASGTNESALAFGGTSPPKHNETEEWNGSAWTEKNNLNTTRGDTTGFGASYTAALCTGGTASPGPRTADTETWDGTSWTEVNNLNTARSGPGGTGTVTSGIAAGGSVPPSTGATETWDGTSWTETSDLNTARSTGAMSGDSSSSALLADGAQTKVVEQWNGSSWTEIAELNQERNDIFGGIGTVTSAIVAGGYSSAPISPVSTINVERWDGTSWTEINNLSTGRSAPGSQGSATSAMVQGGYDGSGTGIATTEIFTADLSNKTITSS